MRAGVVPSATLQTKDGRWVIIGGNGDSVYSRLMAAGVVCPHGCLISECMQCQACRNDEPVSDGTALLPSWAAGHGRRKPSVHQQHPAL